MIPKDYDDLYDNSSEYEDDFSGFPQDEDHFEDDHLIEDYDDDELERRRAAYADLKKNDKIFNNTYNFGYESDDEDEGSTDRVGTSEIKLDSSSPDYHLYDPEKFSDHLDLKIIQRDIYDYIQATPSVKAMIGDEPDKKKFSKEEINLIFETLNTALSGGVHTNVFINSIHVLDSISSITNMEYKKLFDMFSYENKEILLVELNNKYGFLDSTGRNFKIF